MLIRGELSRAGQKRKKKKKNKGHDDVYETIEPYYAVELPADQGGHPTQALTHFAILGYHDHGKAY